MPPSPCARARLLLFVARRSLLASRLTFVLLVLPVALGVGFQVPNRANLAGSSVMLLEEALTHGAGDIRVQKESAKYDDVNLIIGWIHKAVLCQIVW
jgi:hypothetical protein